MLPAILASSNVLLSSRCVSSSTSASRASSRQAGNWKEVARDPGQQLLSSRRAAVEWLRQDEETSVEEEVVNEVDDEEVEAWGFSPKPQKRKKKKGKKNKRKKNRRVLSRMIEKIYRVDDEISWDCNEGYETEGSAKAVCLESGRWSTEPPRCRRVSCGPPSYPSQATVNVTNFVYGGTATYTCREGYIMQGVGTLSCEADGSWSSEAPSCSPVVCGPPSTPALSTTNFVVAEHGVKYGYSSTVTYSCPEGYELQGGEYQVCEADGAWHGAAHTCVEVKCDALPYLLYGAALSSEGVFPQTATLSCHPGYILYGDQVAMCSLGQWLDYNGAALGKITAKHFSFGSIANYSCMYGYMLVGNPSVECVADATWKGEIPVCHPVDCGPLEGPSNGRLDSHYTVLHSRASYQCDPGYQLFGDQARTCTSNATWSGDAPQCFRECPCFLICKDCGEMKAPKHGFAMGVGTHYGDQVRFRCQQGYSLQGEALVTCQASGGWSSLTPTCQGVKCGPPPSPPNTVNSSHTQVTVMEYQDRIFYTCLDGFIMRGDLTATCLETGQWAHVRGQSVVWKTNSEQQGIVIIGRSFYYKDRVRYRCPPGKVTNGSSVLTCLDDGSWSGVPTCVSNCGRRCLNGGVCLTDYVCSCPPGYVGDHCQNALCPLPCLHGGVCTGPHRCTCLPGYSGSRCHKSVCERGCGYGGRCIGPNVCHCGQGNIAPSCDDEGDYEYDYGYYDGYDAGAEQETTVLEEPDFGDVGFVTPA
ncbi:Sushi, von Willebrand factor type A, EGF and pentraxin domain-containing protein 1 [Chionoecetes opilio]|uniref:Sushi, von Willebrand factor type A, EGF and pentraxin domain-containing protein 1 n=1 Tax=Chionoecetes opilio TaxID=41210 RepID=A0A8J4YCN8_CHIOP|nr:Sushi, von Willebrand factor type A, EGF and pentraxin domain-containing protein 1 [Chionoecetes opilio]